MAKAATKPKAEQLPDESKSPQPGDNSVSPELLKAFYRDMLLIRRFEERAGPALRHGADRRLLPSLYRPGSGRRRHAGGAAGGRQRHHLLSRPRPHAGLRHGPQGRHGRADRPRAAAIPRARAARCTCSAARRTSTAATASSAPRCRSAPASPSPTSYRERRQRLRSPISATARSTRARSTRASTWRRCGSCRCVYVIENNQYGMGTSVERASARHRSATCAAQAYGIPGEQVDGMDVLAVRGRGRQGGRACARAGKGPNILEMMTYRYRGHSMSDPAKYRTQGRGRQDAPASTIRSIMLQTRLLDEGHADEAALKDDRQARSRTSSSTAREFAQDSPEPDPSELWTDILVEA